MIRPIDANALKDELIYLPGGYAQSFAGKACLMAIDDAPTLDYAPVKREKWIRVNEGQVYFDVEYMCSGCQFVISVSGIGTPLLYGYKHCPNCGAKMDGGEDFNEPD